MMPVTNLARMVVANTLRSKRHFVLSAFGIVIGIGAFVLFLALTQKAGHVLEKVFPVDEVEVVAPTVAVGPLDQYAGHILCGCEEGLDPVVGDLTVKLVVDAVRQTDHRAVLACGRQLQRREQMIDLREQAAAREPAGDRAATQACGQELGVGHDAVLGARDGRDHPVGRGGVLLRFAIRTSSITPPSLRQLRATDLHASAT